MSDEGKTIWAISSGCYSDYRVDYVCATKEIADAYIADYQRIMRLEKPEWVADGYDGSRVEKLPLVTEPIALYAEWTARGTVAAGLDNIDVSVEPVEVEPSSRPDVRQAETYWRPKTTEVVATCADRSAAIKSVKDRLASLIANPTTETEQS